MSQLSTRWKAFQAAIVVAGGLIWTSGFAQAQTSAAGGGRLSFVFDPYTPMFTNAQVKIAGTSNALFTSRLLADVTNYEPLFTLPGTQVHMGFWSGPGNHGSLVRVLDSINSGAAPCVRGAAPNCAVWDEGATTSEQLPSYVEMLVEHWYDRGNTPAGSRTVSIYGKTYFNVNPVDFPSADRIWGQYSQRYTDLARAFYASTGKPVKAWCFVQGARPTRIFYTYEYPKLKQLEREGVVKVYCARKSDADWQNGADWSQGIGSAACPDPNTPAMRAIAPEPYVNVQNR